MNIVYINSFYHPDEVGGAERSVRFLGEAMVQRGHQAHVICLGQTPGTSEFNGVQVHKLPCDNLYFPLNTGAQPGWRKMAWHGLDSFNPAARRRVGQLLDKLKPDVVHTNTMAGLSVSVWQAAADRQLPLLHTLRDYYLMCPNTAMFKQGQPCSSRCTSCQVLSWPRERATRMVGRVVGNSRFILDKHIKAGLFGDCPQEVNYTGYQPAEVSEAPAAAPMTVGYIGRLAPSKGIEVMLDGVRQSQRPWRVLVAGEGDTEYTQILKARAEGLDVQFLGRVAPETFFNVIDWTVVPTLWDEPLARVLFESFAHGVPVMGAATGGTPELITPGETGHLYDAPQPAQLARLLQTAHDDGKATMAAWRSHCLARAADFRPSRVADRYEQAYLNTISYTPGPKR
jgi:glycosyltransferase involved in cell wall biosynthesis